MNLLTVLILYPSLAAILVWLLPQGYMLSMANWVAQFVQNHSQDAVALSLAIVTVLFAVAVIVLLYYYIVAYVVLNDWNFFDKIFTHHMVKSKRMKYIIQQHRTQLEDDIKNKNSISDWEVNHILRNISTAHFNDRYLSRLNNFTSIIIPTGLLSTTIGLAGIIQSATATEFKHQMAAKLASTAIALCMYVVYQVAILHISSFATTSIDKHIDNSTK